MDKKPKSEIQYKIEAPDMLKEIEKLEKSWTYQKEHNQQPQEACVATLNILNAVKQKLF